MPKSNNVYSAISMVHAINDPIGTHHDLANLGKIELRNDPSQLGKLGQTLRVGYEELTESDRSLW